MQYHNPDSITVYVVCAYSGYGTVCIVGFIILVLNLVQPALAIQYYLLVIAIKQLDKNIYIFGKLFQMIYTEAKDAFFRTGALCSGPHVISCPLLK